MHFVKVTNNYLNCDSDLIIIELTFKSYAMHCRQCTFGEKLLLF